MTQSIFTYYVINLDSSVTRWNYIDTHLRQYGIAATRVSAVYAANLPVEQIEHQYSKALNTQDFFLPLKPAEIGCFMSHRKALEQFVNQSDTDYAVILEDDVEFVRDPINFHRQWLSVVAQDTPAMLKLYARRSVDGIVKYRCGGNRNVLPRVVPLGTQGAVINRAGAIKMLQHWQPFGMPVDVAYQHWWIHGVKTWVTVPNHLYEISDILGGSNIATKSKLSSWFKVKREARRSWFRLCLNIRSRWQYWRQNNSSKD